MQFPYFATGISQTIPTESIHIQSLVELTVNNPKKDLVKRIRELRAKNDNQFKKKKRGLAYITPASHLRYRSLNGDDFELNFISSTGYVYLDYDFKDELHLVSEKKKEFISKYGDQIAFCALSSSLGGFQVLVRVNISIRNQKEYLDVWNYLNDNVFTIFEADTDARDIGRAMFISHDEDVFVNYNSIVDLKSVHTSIYGISIEGVKPEVNKTKNKTKNKNKKKIAIAKNNEGVEKDIILRNDNFRYVTEIVYKNKIVDIETREFNKVYFTRNIPDGQKHEVFAATIHILKYLNQWCSIEDIIHEMRLFNNIQKQKMVDSRLLELIKYHWDLTEKKDYIFKSGVRTIHLNPDSDLTAYQRQCISNRINGVIRNNETILKIKEAKSLIASQNGKVNKQNVAKISGVSRRLVTEYFDRDEFELKQLEFEINNNPIPYPPHPDPEKPSDLN
jgi:hypothetical protein